jgi:ATP-dependent Clp protease ATP-binding subunit ClpA
VPRRRLIFERFTERARQVVVLAQDSARQLSHNYIGTEHLLLGLLREEEGVGARVLRSLNVTFEEVWAQVARIIGQGDEVVTGQIPFTPRAKKVLELSLREALALGHNHIGTEHILLGLVRENEGVAARILLDFDADAETLREEILRLVGAAGASGEAEYTPGAPPFAPEFLEDWRKLQDDKERAIDEQEFEEAARLQTRQSVLGRAAKSLERAWQDEEGDAQEAVFKYPFGERPPRVAPGRRPRGSRRARVDIGARPWWRVPFLVGWILFAVAAAVGLVAGRLIWG